MKPGEDKMNSRNEGDNNQHESSSWSYTKEKVLPNTYSKDKIPFVAGLRMSMGFIADSETKDNNQDTVHSQDKMRGNFHVRWEREAQCHDLRHSRW